MQLRSFVVVAVILSACLNIMPSPPTESESAATTTSPDPATECSVDYGLLCEAIELIQSRYVDEIDLDVLGSAAARGITEYADPAGLQSTCATPFEEFDQVCLAVERIGPKPAVAVEAALIGMIESALDPNSAYYDPEILAMIQDEQAGQVEGIGAIVTTEDLSADNPASSTCVILSESCRLVIISTFPGAPAERAGILPGDVTATVDGVAVDGKTIDEVTAEVRGESGTTVVVGVNRGNSYLTFEIVREAVDIPVVESEMVGTVGYLRLYQFTSTSGGQVDDALDQLLAAGATSFVFDLRDNPGGTLTAAIEIASEFVDQGLVLATVGRTTTTEYPADGKGRAVGIPTIVLVNRGSASASEVVAGAVQDAGAAVVMGETSFGKNTVQQTFDLSNGGALKVTIARWVTRSGRNLDDGVTPDIFIDLPAELTAVELVALATASTA